MDKWSEVKIFEGYDDTDSTYLLMKLYGMQNYLKMSKLQFNNYSQVKEKIKRLAPYQPIKYRTTMHTHSGSWQVDEWFSDIELSDEDHSEEIARLTKESKANEREESRYKIGAKIHMEPDGDGIIKDTNEIGELTVLTIKFDNYEGTMKKVLNLNKMKIVDSAD